MLLDSRSVKSTFSSESRTDELSDKSEQESHEVMSEPNVNLELTKKISQKEELVSHLRSECQNGKDL